HGLDDLDQVIVGLLGEDEDDGGARLGVVLADVAQRGARLFAGDGLHLEGAADLLARAGLQFVSIGPLERQAEGDGQSRNDHQTHRRYSTCRSIEWKWGEEPPLSPLGGDVESAPEVYPCRGRVLQAVPPRGFGRGRAPSNIMVYSLGYRLASPKKTGIADSFRLAATQRGARKLNMADCNHEQSSTE